MEKAGSCLNEGPLDLSARDAYRVRTSPDPFEPFHISQGFRLGPLIVLSGHASLDGSGNIVGENDFDAQADQTFRNLSQSLGAAGSSLDQVIKVTIYLTDMSQFPKIVALREKWFSKPYPADTIVEVSALALPELMIEIEAMALAVGQTVDT